MAQKKYRLQTVMEVRDRAKQEATQKVAARRAELASAEEELARREQAVTDCRAQQAEAQARMLRTVEDGVAAGEVVAHRTHLADLRRLEQELIERVEQQRVAVVRAESELQNALAALIEASKELQVIEKHREGWREQTRRAEQRREQKLGDEIGQLLYEQRKKQT
ncbi:MAG TPA: hypothetical protein VF666_10415 [Pyrinomonadaceae bacterium]|jgi:flagellar export protein FliJ